MLVLPVVIQVASAQPVTIPKPHAVQGTAWVLRPASTLLYDRHLFNSAVVGGIAACATIRQALTDT